MYRPDRIERKNRRKAILLTAVLYGSLLAFFLFKNEINWVDYIPEFAQEYLETPPAEPVVEGPRP